MYKIGDLIIYGSQGVCKVEKIGTPNINGVDTGRIYYTLSPLYQNGKIFTPIDTNIFMRHIMTYTEVQQLIALIPSISENVFNSSNVKLLEDHYQESMQTHDCYDLVKVIKSVYTKNEITVSQGKKLGQIDERFMKRAEDLLYGEFAVVLDIPKETVKSYIEARIKELNYKLIVNS